MYKYNEIVNLDRIDAYLMGRFMYKIYHKEAHDILMISSCTIIIYMIIIQGYQAICMCY